MKACIATFHKADNYGAVLQAYALQKALEKLGVQSGFIEFEELERKANPVREARGKAPHAFVERLRKAGKDRSALFDEFRAKYLKCATPVSAEQSGTLNDIYDVFIAGSDQVWNLKLPEADERYFLPFAKPDKRVSYAASFGTDKIPDNLKEWYKERLNGFHSISVREESGREIVEELTGKDCAVCLDPVLVLNREEWMSLAAQQSGKPYLFLYMVDYDAQLAASAKSEAEERGLELKTATAGFIPQFGIDAWSGVGVEKWLSLIYNSEGVFTNSFHCTAFAMIFGKPVETAMLKEGLARRNGRLEELLRLGGLENANKPDFISAEDFDLRISGKRESSVKFLLDALNIK